MFWSALPRFTPLFELKITQQTDKSVYQWPVFQKMNAKLKRKMATKIQKHSKHSRSEKEWLKGVP